MREGNLLVQGWEGESNWALPVSLLARVSVVTAKVDLRRRANAQNGSTGNAQTWISPTCPGSQTSSLYCQLSPFTGLPACDQSRLYRHAEIVRDDGPPRCPRSGSTQ